MELAKKLKSIREERGYSQAEVAEKLSVSRQAISKWENGWTYPDIDNLVALSELYAISLDELLSEKFNKDCAIESVEETSKENKWEIESIMLTVAAVTTCMLPVAGLVFLIGILIYAKEKVKNIGLIFKIIILLCMIINIYNSFTVLNAFFFHMGRATVEKVALI